MRKTILFFAVFVIFAALIWPKAALADTQPQISRLAGADRYLTSIQISQSGWTQSDTVVLATGQDFPDGLTGTVLAKKFNAPLLLTPSASLPLSVQNELRRLGAKHIFILGGTGAVSPVVESTLRSMGMSVDRLADSTRFGTAARIGWMVTQGTTPKAFLANGYSFPDALSVAPIAASAQAPILLSDTHSIPATTLQTLKDMQVHSVTLIGGTGVLDDNVANTLRSMGISVDRVAGSDRFATNVAAASLGSNFSSVYIATGLDFPDALSGAALAAHNNAVVMQVYPSFMPWGTYSFLSPKRGAINNYVLLGGTGAVGTQVQSNIQSNLARLVSLVYLGPGNSAVSDYISRLTPAASAINYIAPSWISLADGSGGLVNASNQSDWPTLIQWAHSQAMGVLPAVAAGWNDWQEVDSVVTVPTNRSNLVNNLMSGVDKYGFDGLVLDLENFSESSGPGFTSLVAQLADALHARNKFLVVTVLPKDDTSQTWLHRFDYAAITAKADYLNIMTYDYSINSPGPIAPLPWVQTVLNRAISVDQVPAKKILMGIPLYGRHWANGSLSGALSNASAAALAQQNNAAVQWDASSGVPFIKYTDPSNQQHEIWFDNSQSWGAKLDLAGLTGIGGAGTWGFNWPAPSDFWSMLQQKL